MYDLFLDKHIFDKYSLSESNKWLEETRFFDRSGGSIPMPFVSDEALEQTQEVALIYREAFRRVHEKLRT